MHKSKPKILVVLSRFPFPIDKGDKLRAYFQIKELSTRFEIHLLTVSDVPVLESEKHELSKYCKSVEIINLSRSQVVWSLIRGVFSKLPFQSHYFRSLKMRRRIASVIEDEDIQICYVQLLRMHLNIPMNSSCKYYMDYMDAFSLGMEKRLLKTKFPFNLIVQSEVSRLKYLESIIAYYYHGCSIISKRDAEAIEDFLPYKIDVVPNGIDESYFLDSGVEKEYELVFVGNMGYYPNIRAAKFIVEEILPLVHSLKPGVNLTLVGTNPAEDVLALEGKYVNVTGRVDSVLDYLHKSKIFVAPMFAGQGMQNKLLEAMAAKVPVVTTPHAAEAFQNSNHSGISACYTPEEFAQRIVFLLENEEEAKVQSLKAQEYVRKHYLWSENCKVLTNRFQELIESNE